MKKMLMSLMGLPDVECEEAFGRFGVDGYGVDGGQAGAGVGPVDQVADAVGRALEDGFDPAVGELRTQPATPCCSARRRQVSRKKTP